MSHYDEQYEEYCDREYERECRERMEKESVMKSLGTDDMIKIMFSNFWDGLGYTERNNILSGIEKNKQ